MSRGVEGRAIFVDDQDRDRFLRLLLEEKRSGGYRLFAYCLMSNHFHLLLQVSESPLYSFMHAFLTRYSLYFNQRHEHRGHLFQSRYTAPVCRRDTYFENLLRYIHLNPVRAQLVQTAEAWPWSGHRALMGAPDDLIDLGALAEMRGQAIPDLRSDYLRTLAETAEIDLDLPLENPMAERVELPRIAAATARTHGLDRRDLAKRGKVFSKAKLEFIEAAARQGHSLTAIATELNCSPAAVCQLRKRKS